MDMAEWVVGEFTAQRVINALQPILKETTETDLDANTIVSLVDDKICKPSNVGFVLKYGSFASYVSTQLTTNKILITYIDSDGYGKAVILTISGSTITAGTPLVFSAAATSSIAVVKLDSSKALISYSTTTNKQGRAIVLSISGSTITAGSPIVLITTTGTSGAAFYDNTNVLIDTNKVTIFYTYTEYEFIGYNEGHPEYENRNYIGVTTVSIATTTITVLNHTTEVFGTNYRARNAIKIDTGKILLSYYHSGGTTAAGIIVINVSDASITYDWDKRKAYNSKTDDICLLLQTNKVLVRFQSKSNVSYTATVNASDVITFSENTAGVGLQILVVDTNKLLSIIDEYVRISTVSGDVITTASNFKFVNAESVVSTAIAQFDTNKVLLTYNNGISISSIILTISGTTISTDAVTPLVGFTLTPLFIYGGVKVVVYQPFR